MQDLSIIFFWLSIFLLFYSYLAYPLILLILFKDKKPVFQNTGYKPSVTVVFAAYNEEKVIEKKIKNIFDQNYPKELLDIVIGSDNSTDKTVEIAKSFLSENRTVLDFKERRGKLGTLNEAVKNAKGEIIVFTDANAMFDENAIALLVSSFSDKNVGCVSGQKVITTSGSTDAGEGIYWKIESFIKERENYLGSCAGADGALYAVRKELYPFPPSDKLYMDDFFISLKIIGKGFRCIYNPMAKAFEESSKDFYSEIKRKGRILGGAINVLFKMPELLVPFKSAIALQLWSHKILRWCGGFFLLIALLANFNLDNITPYTTFLTLQIGFYCLALLGLMFSMNGIKVRIFYFPYYFLFMNYSQIYGLYVWFKDGRKGFWEKVGR